jgi:hypothetical protein
METLEKRQDFYEKLSPCGDTGLKVPRLTGYIKDLREE